MLALIHACSSCVLEGLVGYLDAVPGDFIRVPAFGVHRESNPRDEPSLAMIARTGGGIPTVNVDPPAGRPPTS
ncbi:MAG: hypothetical protein WCA82_09135 [Jiangellales bacterium]